MKAWPENPNEVVMFSDIVEPLVKAVKFAYKLTRKNRKKDIPYEGYDIGQREKVTCLIPVENLEVASLEWQEEDQGRDALEVIIGIAIQLGIEQGRRVERESQQSDMAIVKIHVRSLFETFCKEEK